MKTAGVNVFFDALNGTYLPKLRNQVKINKESVKINNIAKKMAQEQKYPQNSNIEMKFNPAETTNRVLVYNAKYLDTPGGFYTRVEIFGKGNKIFAKSQRVKYDPEKCQFKDNETVGSPILQVVAEKYNGNYIKY